MYAPLYACARLLASASLRKANGVPIYAARAEWPDTNLHSTLPLSSDMSSDSDTAGRGAGKTTTEASLDNRRRTDGVRRARHLASGTSESEKGGEK